MDSESKKWMLDFSALGTTSEAQNATFDLSQFDSLSAPLLQLPLFIDASTWLPITVGDAIVRLKSDESASGAGYRHFLNFSTICFAIRFHQLVTDLNAAQVFELLSIIEKVALEFVKYATESEISKKLQEFVIEFYSIIFKLQTILNPESCIKLIKSISIISQSLSELPTEFKLDWKNKFFGTQTEKWLSSHPDTTVASECVLLKLKMLSLASETHLLEESQARNLVSSIPNDFSKISSFLPVIASISSHIQTAFIFGRLATIYTYGLSNDNVTEGHMNCLKFVDEKSFAFETVSLLMSSTSCYSNESRKALQYWTRYHSDYTSIESILDEITNFVKKSGSVLKNESVGAQTLRETIENLSLASQYQYILHWLLNFAEISDLDFILTQLTSVDEFKPHVNAVEAGLSILHYLTPLKLGHDSTNNDKSENSNEIDVQVYHNLMNLLLQRMDVPDYFFYLGETRDYDKDNFRTSEMKVKTFQHLIGHYWHLMDSLISHMPPIADLTRDNPIVLVPAGVEAPIEVPPFLDPLLVLMAIHGMPSDFTTKEIYLDTKQASQTLLGCQSIKSLKKSPFTLRIRQCFQLTKSRQKEVLDEATKFSILMWLCRQVPIQELSPSTDSYDNVVVTTMVNAINEVIGDHRPRIKILAIHLVLQICNQVNSTISSSQLLPLLLPQATFDGILRSLGFREVPLVEMALKASIALIKSRSEQMIQVAWASQLMHSISYEMDYIQKKDLLVIYLGQLQSVLPLLGIQIFNFSHPLLVRLVSLLDNGDFKMTQLSLESIAQLLSLSWPRAHLEAELVFGALAAVWIDQVLVLPSESTTELVEKNIQIIKDRIRQCMIILIAVIDEKRLLEMVEQVTPLQDLKPFESMVMTLIESKRSIGEKLPNRV